MTIQEYTRQDCPALSRLWEEAFGDSGEFIDSFLHLLPSLGTCYVAREGEDILAAAYLLTGADAVLSDSRRIPLLYVYAVATDRLHRGDGIGTLLMERLRSVAEQQHRYLYTYPAESWLYGWYRRTLGLSILSCVQTYSVPATVSEEVSEISPAEYMRLREHYLSALPHLLPPDSWAEYLSLICRSTQGALLRTPSGICACSCTEGETLSVADICGTDLPETASRAAAYFHRLSAEYHLPAAEGIPYTITDCSDLPPDFYFSFTFE